MIKRICHIDNDLEDSNFCLELDKLEKALSCARLFLTVSILTY